MSERRGLYRVGLLTITALVALAVMILLVGQKNRLFSPKNEYTMKTAAVSGLQRGNPVQLNGVTVGRVERVVLPTDIGEELLEVVFSVESRYGARVREDSVARIRTLGLLGDKYVSIRSGSPEAPIVPPGGEVPTDEGTDVDKLLSEGEDLVANVLAISHSLRNILERVDRGEGFLGELVTEQEAGRRITTSLYETLDSIQRVTTSIEEGRGPLGRLVSDEEMGERLASAISSLDATLTRVETGDGLLPALIDDPALKDDVAATLGELRSTASGLRELAERLETADGPLLRLLEDEELAAELLADIERLVENLAEVAEKINQGDGTMARVVNDPSVYEAVQDILVGVDESAILRWLLRNRQKKGIEVRYEDAVETGEIEPLPPGEHLPPGHQR